MSQLCSYGCAKLSDDEQKAINHNILRAYWYFTISKLVDLIDTICFVLRKKFTHISFLHVQHHAVALLVTWFYGKYSPGQEFVVIGFFNIFIHVLVYSYYFIASLGPKFRKFLWWKELLTRLQIVQFLVNITFLTISLNFLECGYRPEKVSVAVLINILNMVLFVNFYYQNYLRKNQREQKKLH